jgi:signal transduction histidine kinase
MTQESSTWRENIGYRITSYVILVAAGVVGLRFDPPGTALERWIVVILLAAIAIVQIPIPQRKNPHWQTHLHVGVHGSLIAVLMFLQPGWTMYPVLFVTPIFWAILALPLRQGASWIVAFTLVTATSFALGMNLGEGLVALFLYGVLYSFLGAFAAALARADDARRESQALLAELQDAHEQLQEYALRAEEMAVVEERNRLAREMHDTLGHRLTVSVVQLEAAQSLCTTDQERAQEIVGTVREQVREALQELRSAVATLRTPVEADLQLRSALQRLTAHYEAATGLTIHRILPDEMPPLPPNHRMALYRTAQEALTNVQKHAGAQQIWLVLTASQGAITLLVSDDGRGFSHRKDQPGFGLRGLRERAAQLDGELHVEPRPGGGTQLSLRLPLGQEVLGKVLHAGEEPEPPAHNPGAGMEDRDV